VESWHPRFSEISGGPLEYLMVQLLATQIVQVLMGWVNSFISIRYWGCSRELCSRDVGWGLLMASPGWPDLLAGA